MDIEYAISLTDSRARLETVGGKAASLARLAAAGLPVPDGFCVTTAAYMQFVSENGLQADILADLTGVDINRPVTLDEAAQKIQQRFLAASIPGDIAMAIRAAYDRLGGPGVVVAVRSSATAEDLPEASFAGQQETYLNIQGTQAVLDATRRCWASLWTARAIGYRARQRIEPDAVALAVVVQRLVDAQAAGVLFTANPVSGQRDQILINAAWGLGEAVVGGLVTPDSYTIDKASGQVLASLVSEKTVMTVRADSGTREEPVPAGLRAAPVLNDIQLKGLVDLGRQVEVLYGQPMDIEWALSGGELALLQARPITALPDAFDKTAPQPVAIDWRLPDPKGKYLRSSIIDFMPGPLTPLFESLIVPSVNHNFRQMMARLARKALGMYENFMTTINHFGYLKVNYTTRQVLAMVVTMIPAFPRLLREALPLWQKEALPYYQGVAARWGQRDAAQLSAGDLLKGMLELSDAAVKHLTTLQVSTLGVAASAEGVFTLIYNKMIRREGDPEASTFLLGFESTPIRSEMALFDLAGWSAGHPALAEYLRQAAAIEITARTTQEQAPAGIGAAEWQEWRARFGAYLERYGYSIYELDFARPLPMDEPGPVLETIRLFLNRQGKNPYERQEAAAGRREAAIQAIRGRLRGPRAWAFQKTLGWAQKFGPLREDSIAEIGLGYPNIRRLALELGRRLAASELVEQAGDIFWLKIDELEQAVEQLEHGQPAPDFADRVRARKAELAALRRITPPIQLPGKSRILGIDPEVLGGRYSEGSTGSVLRGLGASAGQATGAARVLSGPEDFDQMHPGDVLVAAITTPAWTPLFALACAVVTDIGGPLSHGSIVAREYGIPAVLGTGQATRRIRSGQQVTVDGTHGTVTLHDEI